jgi:aminopeptidase N
VRRQVRESLQAFYRESVRLSAQQALADERNPDILAVLIGTLGPYGADETRETLLRFLRSESFRNTVADAAIGAMRAQDDPAFVAPLLETLEAREAAFTSGDFAQALGALAHLARNDNDQAAVREFLARHTNHPKPGVKRAALAALGTLGDPKAIAVVETFTRGARDNPERQAAEAALGKLRAARRPTDDLRALRDEVLGFQKETGELRRELETLRKQLEALTPLQPTPSPEPATRDRPRKKGKPARTERP